MFMNVNNSILIAVLRDDDNMAIVIHIYCYQGVIDKFVDIAFASPDYSVLRLGHSVISNLHSQTALSTDFFNMCKLFDGAAPSIQNDFCFRLYFGHELENG